MSTPRFLLLALLPLASQCSREGAKTTASPPDSASAAVATTILPGPNGDGEAFEPSVAIDPARPDRIVAAAMYGNPGARGGRWIWAWQSEDGGRTWSSGQMRPPLVAGKTSGWAADVVAGFDPDGAAVLTSMAGADQPRTDGLGGIVVSRRPRGDSTFGEPVFVMRDRPGASRDRVFAYDKPWMAIDRETASPHRGSVYVISGILGMDLPSESWARTPVSLSRITMLGLDFAVSRDGGRSFGPVRRIADSVFGSDLAVGPTGALEVVYPKSSGSSSAIVNLRSTDGGASFAAPATVTTGDSGASVGGPMVAARPGGEVMACWSASAAAGNRIRCTVRPPGGGWSGQPAFGVPVPEGVTYAFPTAAGTAKGWYLLTYLIDRGRTRVALFRSTGGDFVPIATLATVPGLGLSRWCFDRDCRFNRDDLFMAGDYLSLSAGGGRLAAGYVLPRPGGALTGRAAVYLSVVAEP